MDVSLGLTLMALSASPGRLAHKNIAGSAGFPTGLWVHKLVQIMSNNLDKS